MFKILGALAVILASGLIGVNKYNEFFERRRILFELHSGAEKMRNNLKCMCMPLYENFLLCGEFFEQAAQQIANGKSPCDAVAERARECISLKKEDTDMIIRFAEGLGANDCDGQIRNTELFLKELEENIKDASGELETKGKLCVKGSLLIAAAIVLVLI